MTNTDFSSGVQPVGIGKNTIYNKITGDYATARGGIYDLLNASEIAKEDWLRNEQSRDLAYYRDLALLKEQQSFNERMSNTAYQRTVQDLKKAGLNPILAVDKGSSNVPTASVSSSGGGYSVKNSDSAKVLSLIGSLIAGLVSAL